MLQTPLWFSGVCELRWCLQRRGFLSGHYLREKAISFTQVTQEDAKLAQKLASDNFLVWDCAEWAPGEWNWGCLPRGLEHQHCFPGTSMPWSDAWVSPTPWDISICCSASSQNKTKIILSGDYLGPVVTDTKPLQNVT